MQSWTWAAASRRGTSHEKCGEPRQDAFRIAALEGDSDIVVFVACDGAGSAPRGGVGATIAASTLARCASTWLAAAGRLPEQDVLAFWFLLARERIEAAAAAHGLAPDDFATTAIVAMSDGERTQLTHVGDGAVIVRMAASKEWIALSWPEHGEFAGTTRFLTEGAMPPIRKRRYAARIDRLAVMTDGLERLALDFQAGKPHAGFLDPILTPIAASGVPGHDRALSRALALYLGSDRVNDRTDDDKTLLLAARAWSDRVNDRTDDKTLLLAARA